MKNLYKSLLVFLSLDTCLFGYVHVSTNKVAVAGASGYIGRQVVSELVRRQIPTISLVRSLDMPALTKACLEGSHIVLCDVLDNESIDKVFENTNPTAAIVCLASRSGVAREAWSVDYQGGVNILDALIKCNQFSLQPHYVLLSAFCVGKPLLQFQHAKLKLESEVRESSATHSIVRPTAFFKSLDGQLESVQKGNPILYFGSGECSANAINEQDLAKFLVDCVLKPKQINMFQSTRNIGGPDVPPITKRQQGNLIYDTLNVPEEKRKFVSIPLGLLDILISTFQILEKIVKYFGSSFEHIRIKMDDAAEITRIIKYYASEPMVATAEGEVQGTVMLKDHFKRIAARGGNLEEIDKMTTTAGILQVFVENDYLKPNAAKSNEYVQ